MRVKPTSELLKSRDINYRMKAGMTFAFKAMPGFESEMNLIIAGINAAIAQFEKDMGREPSKKESEEITKKIMLDRHPEIKKLLVALGQGKKLKNIQKMLMDWVKGALPGGKSH